MYKFSWEVPLPHIVSENFLYKPGFKRGHSFLYLDPAVAEYKRNIQDFIESNFDITPIPETCIGVISEYQFFISESFWDRDVTNAVKPTEDAFFSLLKKHGKKLDDSMVLSNIATKIPSNVNKVKARYSFLFDEYFVNYLAKHSIFEYLIGDIGGN